MASDPTQVMHLLLLLLGEFGVFFFVTLSHSGANKRSDRHNTQHQQQRRDADCPFAAREEPNNGVALVNEGNQENPYRVVSEDHRGDSEHSNTNEFVHIRVAFSVCCSVCKHCPALSLRLGNGFPTLGIHAGNATSGFDDGTTKVLGATAHARRHGKSLGGFGGQGCLLGATGSVR